MTSRNLERDPLVKCEACGRYRRKFDEPHAAREVIRDRKLVRVDCIGRVVPRG